jgi:eukaryotic-like serine/threonine-protein kinase
VTLKGGDGAGQSPTGMLRVDGLCDRFEAAWGRAERPRIEDFLSDLGDADSGAALGELVALELALRRAAGDEPSRDEYTARFPARAAVIDSLFAEGSTRQPTQLGSDAPGGVSHLTFGVGGSLAERAAARDLRSSPVPEGYELLEVIGRGGMGVVYRARRVRLNRLVALKMVSAGGYASQEALLRFLGEAESIARLRHANIVQVYDRGECDGLPFYSMEYFAAGSLAQRIGGTPWPAVAAARALEQVARGVAEAHRLGIIHRDLKPANILLGDDGTPKVADFGLAKSLESGSDLTRTDRVLGTPSYMAPEQAEGHTRTTGRAADIYSLGAIFYELITGRPPFKGATALETLAQVRTAEPVPPSRLVPGLSRDAETIALKCLQKEPLRRYAGAQELADDLHRFVAGEIIVARRAGPLERAWNWARRHRAVAALSAALVLALAGGLAGVTWKWRQALAAEATTAHQLGVAKIARLEADESRARAVQSLNRLELQTADLALDRGLILAERGEVARGLHWMLEALRMAPDSDVGLRRAARVNLAAWSRRVHAPRHVFPGPPAMVTSIVPHPDGRRLFAADNLGTVRCWDIQTGTKAGPDLSHPGRVWVIALAPDGHSLVAGGDENVTRIWRLGNEPTSILLSHSAPVAFAAFAPDGRSILTGCRDGVARLWDAAAGSLRRELAQGDQTLAAFLGADGEWCSVEVSGARVRIRPGAGGRQGGDLLHGLPVTALALAPDRQTIVTLGEERLARIWNTASSRLVREILIPTMADAVAFTPDGSVVVVGDQHGEVRFWDAYSGRSLGEPLAHPGQVKSLTIGLDGLTLYAGLSDGSVWQWDLGPDLMVPPPDPADPVEASPDWPLDTNRPSSEPAIYGPDRSVALMVAYPVNTACLWDLRRQSEIGLPIRHKEWIPALAWSTDGRRVATGSIDATVRIWDAASGRPMSEPLRHTSYLQAVAFSPDGKTLASGGYDRLVRLWDAATGQPLGAPLRQPEIVWSLGFSPDGRTLAVGLFPPRGGASQGLIWDLAARKTVGEGILCRGSIESIQFVDEGRRLWTRTRNEARLWDAATCRPIGPPVSAGIASLVATLASDDRAMVTGTSEGTVRLWDAQTGQPTGPPIDVGRVVKAVAFDLAGDAFVVGTEHGLVRLFDRATCKALGPALALDGPIIAVDFTDLGRSIVATAAGTMPVRWPVPVGPDVPAERLAQRIEALTGRHMAADQSLQNLDPSRRRAVLDSDSGTESSGLSPRIAGLDLDIWDEFAAQCASRRNDSTAALWHLGRLMERHPADWLLLAKRAVIYLEAGRMTEAAADRDRALLLGPADAVLDWFSHRALNAHRHRRWREALWYLELLIEKRPAEGTYVLDRSEVYSESGDETAAAADRRRAVVLGIAPHHLAGVAQDLARRGQWSAAASLLAAAGPHSILTPASMTREVLILAKARDRDVLHQFGAEIQERLRSIPDGMAVNNTAWALALSNDLLDHYEETATIAERSLVKVPGPGRGILLNTSGALLYRAGRHRDAIDRLMEGIKIRERNAETPQDWAFLAMACQKLGRHEEARRWLQKLRNWRGEVTTKIFFDNLEIEVLRDEAEKVVEDSANRGSVGPSK